MFESWSRRAVRGPDEYRAQNEAAARVSSLTMLAWQCQSFWAICLLCRYSSSSLILFCSLLIRVLAHQDTFPLYLRDGRKSV